MEVEEGRGEKGGKNLGSTSVTKIVSHLETHNTKSVSMSQLPV